MTSLLLRKTSTLQPRRHLQTSARTRTVRNSPKEPVIKCLDAVIPVMALEVKNSVFLVSTRSVLKVTLNSTESMGTSTVQSATLRPCQLHPASEAAVDTSFTSSASKRGLRSDGLRLASSSTSACARFARNGLRCLRKANYTNIQRRTRFCMKRFRAWLLKGSNSSSYRRVTLS